jgi:predicted phage baseplate assembly protein
VTTDEAPRLDPRDDQAIARELLARLPGYVPGWRPASSGPAQALIQAFARDLRALAERLNQAPDKHKLAFLDQLGLSLLPAQAARAPLVLSPFPQLGDGRVPARTRVGAKLPGQSDPLVFETEQTIGLAAARLAEVVALWPGRDAYADHSDAALAGRPFGLFDAMRPLPHALYLAHAVHAALAGDATVELQIELREPAAAPLELAWEFWDGERWRAFAAFAPEDRPGESFDGTGGLTRSGLVRLVSSCAGSQPTSVNGLRSSWLRARTLAPLAAQSGGLPLIARLQMRTVIDRSGDKIAPQAAYAGTEQIDLSRPFAPLGLLPTPGRAFYLACDEALAKPGAAVKIALKPLDSNSSTKTVDWQYWDKLERRWLSLGLTDSGPVRFDTQGTLELTVPERVGQTQVNGRTAAWLRAVLTTGSYTVKQTITSTTDNAYNGAVYSTSTSKVDISVPVTPQLGQISLSYTYQSPFDTPQLCLTHNDFVWRDQSAALNQPGAAFAPFAPSADLTPALYLGFDKPLPADLVSLYLDIEEQPGRAGGPALRWEFYDGAAWQALAVADETRNLALPGMVAVVWPGEAPLPTASAPTAEGQRIQLGDVRQAAAFAPGDLLLVAQGDKSELATLVERAGATLTLRAPLAESYTNATVSLARLPRFGQPRSWLRASLREDGDPPPSTVRRIALNAVWAAQIESFENEPLGAGNGQPGQVLFLRHTPVLEGQVIEVRELSGARAAVELPMLRDELLARGLGDADIRTVSDRRTGQVSEVWVRWSERPNLFFSGPEDRHYTVERTLGRVIFGDGRHGRLPPVGVDNIAARFYRAGGGLAGNVAAGGISQLLSGVPVQTVGNARAGEGGADGETAAAVRARGPLVTRHRRQAISADDYAALALDASPAVAVARALPTTHPAGHPAPGWVTLIIVPHSQEARPQPSFELRRQVQAFVALRAPASAAGQIGVVGPAYLPVGVEALVRPADPSAAGAVRAAVLEALQRFLHPLTGGPEGKGWPFGRAVYLSDVAALLEGLAGVDYIDTLSLLLDGSPRGELVGVPPDRIVVAGPLRVRLQGDEG